MSKRLHPSLLIVVVTCVGVVGLVLLARTWKPRPMDEGLSDSASWSAKNQSTEADHRAVAESASPILDAIYLFKDQNGLWPIGLDELVPDYVTERRIAGWHYKTRLDGNWKLIGLSGFPHTSVQYSYFGNQGGRWEVSWGSGEVELRVAYIPPSFKSRVHERITEKMYHLILQRIDSNPQQIVHHKGLISKLYRSHHFEEARKACIICLSRWPDLWWPNMMLSLISVDVNQTAEAEQRLLAWVEKHDDFQHWFFAAHFYEATGQKEKCVSALRKAAGSPLNTISVKWQDTREQFGSLEGDSSVWYAALIAYRAKKFDVCLEICARWEQYLKERSGAPGHKVFQAACYLNQGKVDDAKAAIQAAVKPFPNHGYSYDTQIMKLRNAIEARNTKFHYTPHLHIVVGGRDVETDMPDQWDLLVDYE